MHVQKIINQQLRSTATPERYAWYILSDIATHSVSIKPYWYTPIAPTTPLLRPAHDP